MVSHRLYFALGGAVAVVRHLGPVQRADRARPRVAGCVRGSRAVRQLFSRKDQEARRMKIALATVVLLAIPKLVLACPVCFGNPNSPQTKAAQAGILALLMVTVAMLASIGRFFFICLRRRIKMVEESNGG